MAKDGSIWVEGTELHFIDGSGTEYAYSGTDTGSNPSGAVSGSIWLGSGDNKIHYIDANGNERTTPRSVGANVSGVAGSIWIENGYVTYLDTNADKVTSHTDVAFDDKAFGNHSDSQHSDNPDFGDHQDNHANFDDVIHDDKAGDNFSDADFGIHGDDAFGNFTDGFSHTDDGYDDFSHTDGYDHTDTVHADDSHNDTTHQDEPHPA